MAATNQIYWKKNAPQTHSNIGYIVTLALNLSLLIPRAEDPRVNNYVLVLYVEHVISTCTALSSDG